MKKNCMICGAEFETTNKRKLCCSKKCQGINRRKRLAEYQKKYYKEIFDASRP